MKWSKGFDHFVYRERPHQPEKQRDTDQDSVPRLSGKLRPALLLTSSSFVGQFIDYKTSMVTDEDPLRGFFFYWDLAFFHTLHVLEERRRRSKKKPLAGERAAPSVLSGNSPNKWSKAFARNGQKPSREMVKSLERNGQKPPREIVKSLKINGQKPPHRTEQQRDAQQQRVPRSAGRYRDGCVEMASKKKRRKKQTSWYR